MSVLQVPYNFASLPPSSKAIPITSWNTSLPKNSPLPSPNLKGKISCTSQQEVLFFLEHSFLKVFHRLSPKVFITGQVHQPCNSTNPEFITSFLLNMFIQWTIHLFSWYFLGTVNQTTMKQTSILSLRHRDTTIQNQ